MRFCCCCFSLLFLTGYIFFRFQYQAGQFCIHVYIFFNFFFCVHSIHSYSAFSLSLSLSVCLSVCLSLSLSLSLELPVPGYQRAAKSFSSRNYFHISVLRVPVSSNMCMPLALETVLRTLSENCQFTSWDIRGKGKMTTPTVRFIEDTGAIEDQHELVRSVTRYRKESPGELRRDAKRVKTRQQEQASKEDSQQQTSLSSSNDGLEASNTGRFVSPPSQYQPHPLDASHRSEVLDGSVDNGDHREDEMVAQEQCCDVAETMAVPEDVQQFWDDQSDGLKYYLSTLAPEHVSTVVSSAARPVVKKIVMDQRDGKNSFYAMTAWWRYFWIRPGQVFCDRLVSIRSERQKNESNLWQRRKMARSWSSEVPTTGRQHETTY